MRVLLVGAVVAVSMVAVSAGGQENDAGVVAGPVGPVGPAPGASPEERATWLKDAVEAAILARPGLVGARIGIAVVDVASGWVLYEKDADGPYGVASNVKIVTTGAALSLLGPDFAFFTAVYADGLGDDGVVTGDLYLKGRADPSLGTAELRELVQHIKLAGVTVVRGHIVVDDSYFDDQVLPPHFDEKPKDTAAYRAPIGAVSLNFNMVTLVVRPAQAGQPAHVVVDPPGDYVVLLGEVITVAQGRTRVAVATGEARGRLDLTITGQIRADAGLQRIRLRVPEPHLFVGSALRALLAQQRIRVVKSTVERRPVPPAASLVALRTSPALAVLVRGMGKYSNNFVAEMVLKTIGAEVRVDRATPATWADGQAAVRRYLVDQVGLVEGSFRYDNGSGLFDASAFSPRQITTVLRHAYRDFRSGPDVVASLATAGADGTLRGRLVGTAAERQVRAKTGTLDKVVALSGYAALDGTRPLAFAIAINDLAIERRGSTAKADARTLVDEIAVLIVVSVGAP